MGAQSKNCQVVKVDDDLGLVFGWAIICKIAGEDYYDLQGDHIPEDVMLKAVADFASAPVLKVMHDGAEVGTVLLSMAMTTDVAKAFGLTTELTGWMVAVKPGDEVTLTKFRDGTLKAFSIGGSCTRVEVDA